MKQPPEPRVRNHILYGRAHPVRYGETWLESEQYCYPHGGMTRRARVRFPDGKLRVVRCGISNTWFSIPVRKSDGDGYISVRDEPDQPTEFVFNPHTK